MEHLVFHDALKRLEPVVAHQSADPSLSIHAEGVKSGGRGNRNLELRK